MEAREKDLITVEPRIEPVVGSISAGEGSRCARQNYQIGTLDLDGGSSVGILRGWGGCESNYN